MIPTTDTTRKLTGSLGGERHLMSIDAANIPHLMGILTDLYSDPEMAVIREYSTNALDSHVMAGVTEPIRISLPTPLRQTFEVKDVGQGLSVEEIVKVYGSYGASTKRETNDANGMLGLGSKSALTYTNMFTVRAVKNGVQAEVAFFRNADGSGAIEVVDTKSTTDHNGVTIIIPTKANSSFKTKALDFYKTWQPGTVEVIGEKIPFILENEKAFQVNGSWIVPNPDGFHTFIVMGGVAYPIKNEDRRYYDRFDVYHFADMGAVEFVPSREALNFTPRTKEYVEDVLSDTSATEVTGQVQRFIDTAKTLDEAYEKVKEFQWVSSYNPVYTWDNMRLETRHGFGNKTKAWNKDGEGVYQWEGTYAIDLSAAESYAFCKKPEGSSFSFKNKAQMRQLLAKKKYEGVTHIIFGERPENSFLAVKCKQIPWSKVIAEDVPKAKRQRGAGVVKPKPEYPLLRWYSDGGGTSWVTTSYQVIDDSKELIYTTHKHNSVMSNYINDNHNAVIAYVEPRRLDKFNREYPNAKTWKSVHDELASKLPEPTKAEMYRMYQDRFSWRKDGRVDWLIKEGYADSMVKEIHAVKPETLAKKKQMWDNVGKTFPTVNYDYVDKHWPLLNLDHKEHSRLYCEAVRNTP